MPSSSSERDIRQALDTLAQARPVFWSRTACGVTRSLTPIPALLDRNAYSADTTRSRVLLIGGLSGRAADVDMALHALELFAGGGDGLALRVGLSAVPCGNPDGLRLDRGPDNGAGGNPSQGYPPEGNFYFDEQNPEKRYLWRWICFQAPDLVIAVRSGDGSVRWECNAAARRFAPALGAREMEKNTLLGALGEGYPEGLGVIPAIRLTASEDQLPREISRLFGVVQQQGMAGKSSAREVLDHRRARNPLEIARILAAAYGHTFDPIVYTQGVPISGRLQLAQLDPDGGNPAPEIAELLSEFVGGGLKDGLAPSALASVVWGSELSQATGDSRYADMIVQAADRFQSASSGEPPVPCDPDFRTEDMFMAGAMLGRAFQHTGERRYVGGNPAPEIAELLSEFVGGGLKDGLAPSALASVVWGSELSQATGDSRYADMIVQAADRFQSASSGEAPVPCDSDFRTEDMFMAGALLGRAFQHTGERHYVDILAQFLLEADIQQDNGLFWHCRPAPFYWGRGNGFAALGLTETLTYLPEDHAARADITDMYLDLLDSLRDLQRQSGMLPQVLDFPGSYDEFTATCMMGYSIARGLRKGWLDDEWRTPLELAWQGVSERIDEVGNVVDACASTGVQQNVRDYLDRPAIYGFDDRSGGMALWFALEMERLARGL